MDVAARSATARLDGCGLLGTYVPLDGSVGDPPVTARHRCFDDAYGRPAGAVGVLDVASACMLAPEEPDKRPARRVAAVRRDPSGLTGVILIEVPRDAGH